MEKYQELLQRHVSLDISVAHLAVLWDLLFYELVHLHSSDGPLAEAHRRALWIICDRFENILCELGAAPRDEWKAFLQQAKDVVETFPCLEPAKSDKNKSPSRCDFAESNKKR